MEKNTNGNAVDNISIGIVVVKDSTISKKGKVEMKQKATEERQPVIHYINISRHREFIENVFSIKDEPKEVLAL